MKKAFIPLAIIMVVILLVTGCGKATTTTPATTTPAVTTTAPTSTTAPTPTIKKGGTLRIIYGLSPASTPGWPGDTTNPQKLWANWICFEGLVKLDTAGVPSPWLATDWKFGPQNSYIDFNLRKDVKFHDGTNFTAESVVTHINQLFLDKDPNVTNFTNIEKTGDYSVRLNIKLFTNNFWNALSNWSMVYTSDTQFKEKGMDYVKEHPVGTGPFLFKSFEKDVSLKFVKNPNYWQVGKPYLDEIDFITVKENLTQQAKMQANEGDVLTFVSDGKELKDFVDKGMNVIFQTGASNFIMFDTANEGSPTNDPNVRIAIEYAINKQEIADTLGSGYMKPNNQIPFTGNPAFNFKLGSRDFNPTKAKELLAAAGYGNGLTLTLIFDVSGQDFAVMIQQYLEAVGITLTLEPVDNAKLWNYLFAGWQGMISTGYAMGTSYPAFIQTYFPPYAAFDKSVKLPQEILDKCDAAMIETDPVKFKTLSDEISQWVWDNDFFVPTVGVAMGYILRQEVKDSDFLLKFVDFSFWSPENCWLDR
jgi:peptide/nickel transport system substrate-binding protein